MLTAVVIFLFSMLCGTILTPLVRRMAHRAGWLDHALSSRKIHGRPVPRLGGIAIVAAFYLPLLLLFVFQTNVGLLFLAEREHVIGLFAGGIIIALLGLYDDLRGAGAGRKFIVQFLVAGLLYRLGFKVDALANPFGSTLMLGWLSLPFTLLWIVGVINAMNLIDGLDGLAGGVALIAVITTFLVSLQRGHPLMLLFSSALAGSIIGFLFYNFNPASIFMGDTGSMFLGFVLAATAIQTNQKASTAFAIVIPAIALGLPIMDTLLAIARRAIRGRPLFQADKEHIHHKLLATGLTHRQTVLVLYGFCTLLGATALVLTYASSIQATLLLIALGLVSFIFLRSLGFMKLNRVSSADRRRSRALRSAVRPLGQRLRAARNRGEVWELVKEALGIFNAVGLNLTVAAASAGSDDGRFRWGLEDENTEPGLFRAEFPIPGGKSGERILALAWTDGRTELDRDTEIAVDILCEYLGDAIDSTAVEKAELRPSRGVGRPHA
jgi:UDP-GlcNAc:undecaprenyl-phosphate GlcNAc-1-phosphate transferase